MSIGIALAILGAASAVVFAGFGSILGVGRTGLAGAGLTAEEPEKFGKVLVLQALPGTQGIYGFLGAVLALQKIGLLGGEIAAIDMQIGLQILIACLPIAITGFLSGIFQGKVATAGINMIAKRPETSGKGIIMAAMVETYAVIGLLATILMINGISVA